VICGAAAVATSAYAPTAASRNSPISTAAARNSLLRMRWINDTFFKELKEDLGL
jgi:hypothetical protein